MVKRFRFVDEVLILLRWYDKIVMTGIRHFPRGTRC